MVSRIGKDDAVGDLSGQRGNSRLIGHVSRREEQRSLLTVQIGKLILQEHVVMAGSRNVARSPRAGSDPINSFMHCCEHHRMLAHAQVIVGTPDGNLILQTMIKGLRKVAGASLQVRKDPISIFASDELETRLKELIEIHRFLSRAGSA